LKLDPFTQNSQFMSTDTYGIRIEKKEGKKIQIRVFNVYGDWVGIPASRNFFMRIIGSYYSDDNLLYNVQSELDYNEEKEYEAAPKYIKDFEVISTLNYPGILEHTFYYERDGGWQNEELLPQILFEVEVTEEAWIQHLEVGYSWGSTAYGSQSFFRKGEKTREDWNKFQERWRNKLVVDAELLDYLIEFMQSQDDYVAWNAIELIRENDIDAQKALLFLMEAVGDRNTDVAFYAVEALGKIGDVKAFSVLLPFIGEAHFRLLYDVLIAVAQINLNDARLQPIFERIASDVPIYLQYIDGEMHPTPASNYSKAIAAAVLYLRSAEQKYLDLWVKEMTDEVDIVYVSCRMLEGFSEDIQQKALAALKAVFEVSDEHKDTILYSGLASHFEA
jgi:hypothetical protein